MHQLLAQLDQHDLSFMGTCLLVSVALLFRWLVGLHSYSGAGKGPMYGDFEAQRHWMELTTGLPLHQWYWPTKNNDLMYWGLDYPPLTAYLSYIFGKAAELLYPDLVALHTSRGHETTDGKVFMRLSVLATDLLIYLPALFYFCRVYLKSIRRYVFLMLSLQPALLLIDHGHFQVRKP